MFCSLELQTIGKHFLKQLAHCIKQHNRAKRLGSVVRQFPRLGDNHSNGNFKLIWPNTRRETSVGKPEKKPLRIPIPQDALKMPPL
jgi:hypothetical protein